MVRESKPLPKLSSTAESDASLLSRLFFQWIQPLIRRGAKTPLQENDLPPIVYEDQAGKCGKVFHLAYRSVVRADMERRNGLTPTPQPVQHYHIKSTDYSPFLMRLAAKIPSSCFSRTYRALAPAAGGPFIVAAFWKPLWLLGSLGQAFAIRALVTYVMRRGDGATNSASPFAYIPVAIAMALGALLMSVSSHAVFSRSMRAGMRARSALSAEIYNKTLRLAPSSFSKVTEGELGNLLQNDTQRVLDSFTYFHFCGLGFVEVFVFSGLLFIDLGWAAVFGIAMLIFLIPTQVMFSKLVRNARAGVAGEADVRVQKMNEILSGIRTIKLSAWEPHFKQVIAALRAREIKYLRKGALLRSLNAAVFFTAPILIAFVSFTARALVFKKQLTPAVVFSSLAYFWQLSHVLNLMPVGWLAASEAAVSSVRLDKFFDLPELPQIPSHERLDEDGVVLNSPASGAESQMDESEVETGSQDQADSLQEGARVEVKHAQFSYVHADSMTSGGLLVVLNDINFSVHDGELISVVGPVGSGKSSLLRGILGEIPCTNGSVLKDGQVAYCAQEPWIVNGTVRENITMFGAADGSFDDEWYQKVLDACCLHSDLQALPASDMTEIGERGVNLSGGQKARVSLARAVFSKADLYLLDDPLSAVDASVSAKLIRNLFGGQGLLADKAQIIVTHQLNLLPSSSKVLVLGGGTIDHFGTFEELREIGVEFTGFGGLEDDLDDEEGTADQGGYESEKFLELDSSEENHLRQILRNAQVDVDVDDLKKQNGTDAPLGPLKDKLKETESFENVNEEGRSKIRHRNSLEEAKDLSFLDHKGELVTEEDRQTGRVTSNVYRAYIKAGGGYVALTVVMTSFFLAQGLRQVAEWWMAKWSNLPLDPSDNTFLQENRFHALIFFVLTSSLALLTGLRAGLFAERTMSASRRLHDQLLDRVLHARPSFFDTNPMGRILNRFSKDVDQMDVMLPMAAQDCLQIAVLAFGSMISIAIVLPWFTAPLILIVTAFLLLQRFYKMSSRELKRIDGVSRSPIYAQFVETTVGLSTIRAFQSEKDFSVTFNSRIDNNHRAYHMFAISGRWLGIRLDLLSGLVSLSTSIAVLMKSETLSAGLAGMVLTQSIILTGLFQWGVRQAAETENLFTSVERVSDMATNTPVERDYEKPEKQSTNWPSAGRIVFDNVTLKYRPELDPALSNLSFKILPSERIGIVGRTGSGKSSLLVALFRMVELTEGSICIDDVDISEVGLHDLRSQMAIVPQDPVLFNGTVRSNLDPTGSYNDAQLWDALHRVHMKDALQSISGNVSEDGCGLDFIVGEKGGNFSAGERQLLSLARAILSGVKVVVLDEASASLDNHTDMLIQKTVREEFSNRTVLTIAHRLATIADCDRILVMDTGEVTEFDSPATLIKRGGYFARLVEESGRIESALLKAIIAEASNANKNED